MSKKFSLILFAAALLLTAGSLIARWSDKAPVRAAGRLFSLPPGEIDGVECYRGEQALFSLARNGAGDWKLDVPAQGIYRNAPDRAAVEALLAFIARAEGRAAEITSPAAGLDANPKLQLVVRAKDKTSSIYLGGYSADGRWRYLASDSAPDQILQVDGELARALDRDPAGMRTLDLFDLPTRGPDSITIDSGENDGEGTIELRAVKEGWVIVKPVNWPADAAKVGRLLRLCAMLRASGIVAPAAPEKERKVEISAETRLPAGKHPALVLRFGKQEQRVIFAGSPGAEKALAVRSGRRELYEIPGAVLREVAGLNAEVFRSRLLRLLGGKSAAVIELMGENGKRLRLIQREGVWQAEGDYTFAVEKVNADNLLALLDNLPIREVVDEGEGKLAEYGLDRPELTLAAYDAGGAELASLKVASVPVPAPVSGGDRYYAKLSGRREVVELEPLGGVFLTQDFIQYRSRLVSAVDFKNILKIKIVGEGVEREYWQNTGTQWQQVKPETVILSENGNWDLLRMVRDLAYLRCEGFVPEKNTKNKDFGLDQPLLNTILTMRFAGGGGKERQTLELRVGNSVKIPAGPGQPETEYYYASLSGFPGIFILNKKFVERLRVVYK